MHDLCLVIFGHESYAFWRVTVAIGREKRLNMASLNHCNIVVDSNAIQTDIILLDLQGHVPITYALLNV